MNSRSLTQRAESPNDNSPGQTHCRPWATNEKCVQAPKEAAELFVKACVWRAKPVKPHRHVNPIIRHFVPSATDAGQRALSLSAPNGAAVRGRSLRQAERSIDFQQVALQAVKPDADPFDLLCHLAFNAPVLTRRQRADRMKKQQTAFFKFFAPEAREILSDLLEKYATDGELQFTLPDVLKVPPISHRGNVNEIIGKFGGADQLRNAVNQLQTLLYAA